MKQYEVSSIGDLSAKLNQLRLAAETGFKNGLDTCYLAISRKPIEGRSAEQNRLLWPLLTDWSKQVKHVDNRTYSAEQWKDIITAGFEGVVNYAPSLNGSGLIAFGARTSSYGKKKFSELIEFIYAEGGERGVVWSEKSKQTVNEVRG